MCFRNRKPRKVYLSFFFSNYLILNKKIQHVWIRDRILSDIKNINYKDQYIVATCCGCLKLIGKKHSAISERMMNVEDETIARWEKEDRVCVCRAMPQHKFHRCDYSRDRLPDLTSDMCRLLSYRSLNGLVRNHPLNEDRKWRDEEERSSPDGVKVGKKSRMTIGTIEPSFTEIYKVLRAHSYHRLVVLFVFKKVLKKKRKTKK